MTNEEKLKLCIVPSNELRQAAFSTMMGQQIKKLQQRFYDYDGKYFVWRDVKNVEISGYEAFSKSVMFE